MASAAEVIGIVAALVARDARSESQLERRSMSVTQTQQGPQVQRSQREMSQMPMVSVDVCVDQSVEAEWMSSLQVVTDDLASDDGSTDRDERDSKVAQRLGVQSDRVTEDGADKQAAQQTNQGDRL